MSAAYDVAVIGAGPAGATLARLLGGKMRVLLVDRRNLDRDFDGKAGKCCGGLVAPDAQKAIAEFGLGLPAGVMAGPQLFAVRTIDLSNGLERYYQRFYINVDRERFDRWLVSLAAAAETRFGCGYLGYERAGGGFRIRLRSGGREFTEEAGVLVGADGALSPVRRQAFPLAPRPETYVAVQECFEAADPAPYFSALFDRATTDFYCWTIPKEGVLLLGAALRPGKDAAGKFEALKRRLPAFGYEPGRRVRREGAAILRPRSVGQICTGAQGIALAGEAAGFISPSSCEGMSYAFRSAAALAEALAPGVGGFESRYARAAADIRLNIFVKNLKSPFMYAPPLRRAVMRSGLGSLKMFEGGDA
jgi:flavin-dependent dehydrogenase